jgi:hypothetical protein
MMPLIGIGFKFCSVFEDAKDYYHDYTRKERAGTPSRKTPKDVEGKSHLEGETGSEKDNQRTQKKTYCLRVHSLYNFRTWRQD